MNICVAVMNYVHDGKCVCRAPHAQVFTKKDREECVCVRVCVCVCVCACACVHVRSCELALF